MIGCGSVELAARMAFLAKLLPQPEIMKAWANVLKVAEWAKIKEDVLLEFVKELGEDEIPDMEVFAAVEPTEVAAAMVKLKYPALKRTRFNLFLNGVRGKYELPLIDYTKPVNLETPGVLPQPQVLPDIVEAIAKATRSKGTGNGIKVAHVLDQGSSEEVAPLEEDEILTCRNELHTKLEGEPLEAEEFTDSQLTVFKRRMDSGGSPACDYGVLGPYGSRAERRMKFLSVIKEPNGTERTIEVAGPNSLETWETCHQIFRALCIACKVCKLATLDNYRTKFKERCAEYPSHWGLAMAADVICRTELWPRLKGQQKRLYDDPKMRDLAAYDPAMPWDAAIAASTVDAEFWGKHFERKAQRMIAEGKQGQPIHEVPGGMPSQEHSGSKRRRGGEARHMAMHYDADVKRPDGRYYVDRDHKRFCADYHAGGCATPCRDPRNLSHNCEYCKRPHRSTECWYKPKDADKGKGKGKKKKGSGNKGGYGRAW